MRASYVAPSSSSLAPQALHEHHRLTTTTLRCRSSPVTFPPKPHARHGVRWRSATVRARASPSSSSIADLDLYGLLGVESSSDQLQIKNAYRALQKRCHPDIAGAAGHDMAIVLNEAYSLLSDPISRSAYDKEQAKISEFRGYTGKPLYSVWVGSESEQRAVFVDEVRCVGCLKCALFASNTFAIESAYGRARAIRQWADPEHQILEAIRACPVDCISFVERSDLPALEFLMSRQPRGRVSMTTGRTGGARISNVFDEIEKFQRRFQEMKDGKNSAKNTHQHSPRSNARFSTIQRIMWMTNWLYWMNPAATGGASAAGQARQPLKLLSASGTSPRDPKPDLDKLREAAARMRKGGNIGASRRDPSGHADDEYWTLARILAPPSEGVDGGGLGSRVGAGKEEQNKREGGSDLHINLEERVREKDPVGALIPVLMGLVSAIVVAWGDGGGHLGVGLEDHVGGRMAVEVVNSFELQVVLAGITWYLCGTAGVGLIKKIKGRIGSKI